jgi:hypothetical protein
VYLARTQTYDPSTGRWGQFDPIAFDAGQSNLYQYAGNDPTNAIDSTGMAVDPNATYSLAFSDSYASKTVMIDRFGLRGQLLLDMGGSLVETGGKNRTVDDAVIIAYRGSNAEKVRFLQFHLVDAVRHYTDGSSSGVNSNVTATPKGQPPVSLDRWYVDSIGVTPLYTSGGFGTQANAISWMVDSPMLGYAFAYPTKLGYFWWPKDLKSLEIVEHFVTYALVLTDKGPVIFAAIYWAHVTTVTSTGIDDEYAHGPRPIKIGGPFPGLSDQFAALRQRFPGYSRLNTLELNVRGVKDGLVLPVLTPKELLDSVGGDGTVRKP